MAPADVLFGSTVAFLAGVFVAGVPFPIYAVLGSAIASAILVSRASRGAGSRGLFALLLLSSFFLGLFYFHAFLAFRDVRERIVLNTPVRQHGIIVSELREEERFQSFLVSLEEPMRGTVRIIASPLRALAYGDRLELRGVVLPRRGIADHPSMFFPDIETLQTQTFSGSARSPIRYVQGKLFELKRVLLGQFRMQLPYDEAALLGGLTFGARSDISNQLKTAMEKSGTTHLVALSGYNITILVLAIAFIFNYWLSRRATFFLTGIVILLFVIMVGASASVVRAGLMGFLALLAREAGRRYDVRNAIALAAAGMTLVNPTALRFDLGFQLSFLSLLGIVYVTPALLKIFRVRRGRDDFIGWRGNGVTTLAAQLAVIPLLLGITGRFSLSSFVANVLILEFVPLTMFLGFILAVVGTLLSSAGFLIAQLVRILLVYEIGVMRIFARVELPLGNIFGGWSIIALYALGLIVLVACVKEKRADAPDNQLPHPI